MNFEVIMVKVIINLLSCVGIAGVTLSFVGLYEVKIGEKDGILHLAIGIVMIIIPIAVVLL